MRYLILALLLLPVFIHADPILGSKTDAAMANVVSRSADAVGDLVTSTINGLKSAKDFAVEQAPLIVQEYIHWKIAESITYMSMGLIFIVLSIYFIRLFQSKCKEYKENGKDLTESAWPGLIIISIAGFILGIPMFFINLHELLYIGFAPRIYVIEHLVELVKYGHM